MKVDRTRYFAWAAACLFLLVASFGVLILLAPTPVPPGQARLVVLSEPPEAKLAIDGRDMGRTGDVGHMLAPGSHTVDAQLDGYARQVKRIELREGDSELVELRMCRSRVDKTCRGTESWWVDGCDNLQELAERCQKGKVCQDGNCTTGTAAPPPAPDAPPNVPLPVAPQPGLVPEPTPACTPHSKKKCVGTDAYWFDSCDKQEELASKCGQDEQCSSGDCKPVAPVCKKHARKDCVDNDVYWFDSCDKREEIASKCGRDEECSDGDCKPVRPVCKKHAKKGCAGNDVYWFDSCENREEIADRCATGEECSNGACKRVEPACRDRAKKDCVGNDVVWFDSCGKKGETAERCKADQVCTNGACRTTCTAKSSKRCVGTDVYWFDSCDQKGEIADKCEPDEECSGGTCKPRPRDCEKNVKKACSGNAVYWFDSCNARGDLVEKCRSTDECTDGECVDPRQAPRGGQRRR